MLPPQECSYTFLGAREELSLLSWVRKEITLLLEDDSKDNKIQGQQHLNNQKKATTRYALPKINSAVVKNEQDKYCILILIWKRD